MFTGQGAFERKRRFRCYRLLDAASSHLFKRLSFSNLLSNIPTTDTTEIKQLFNRVKQGELDQGDTQLIEKLLNILLTIVSLIQRRKTRALVQVRATALKPA